MFFWETPPSVAPGHGMVGEFAILNEQSQPMGCGDILRSYFFGLSFWHPGLVGIAIEPDFLVMDLAEEFGDFRDALLVAIHLLRVFLLFRPLVLFRTNVQFLP